MVYSSFHRLFTSSLSNRKIPKIENPNFNFKMDRSSSGIGSNLSFGTAIGDVRCDCGKIAMVFPAWTNDNPGRRFYRCGELRSQCDFFRWFDLQAPHGWQKRALLEARDLIRQQKKTISDQKEKISTLTSELNVMGTLVADKSVVEKSRMVEAMEVEMEKLKLQNKASNEKEKMLGQFVIISWIGFVTVIAIVVSALK